jgi:hypothetical protein
VAGEVESLSCGERLSRRVGQSCELGPTRQRLSIQSGKSHPIKAVDDEGEGKVRYSVDIFPLLMRGPWAHMLVIVSH